MAESKHSIQVPLQEAQSPQVDLPHRPRTSRSVTHDIKKVYVRKMETCHEEAALFFHVLILFLCAIRKYDPS